MENQFDSQPLLLVEDDMQDIYFFTRTLHRLGAANPLQVAHDGEEAIDYLGGHGPFADRVKYPLPVAVLLDLKLTRKSGWDVMDWMSTQPRLAGISVIVLTGSAAPDDILRAYQLGALSYLVKPPQEESLRGLLTALRRCADKDWNRTGDELGKLFTTRSA